MRRQPLDPAEDSHETGEVARVAVGVPTCGVDDLHGLQEVTVSVQETHDDESGVRHHVAAAAVPVVSVARLDLSEAMAPVAGIFGMPAPYILDQAGDEGVVAHAAPEGVTLMTDINRYLTFVLKMFFAFGAAFEIPVATILLVRSGLATADGIARKRPYVIVGCFIVGMLLTPPDPITQILLAIPVWLLFEVGILLSRSTGRRSKDD